MLNNLLRLMESDFWCLMLKMKPKYMKPPNQPPLSLNVPQESKACARNLGVVVFRWERLDQETAYDTPPTWLSYIRVVLPLLSKPWMARGISSNMHICTCFTPGQFELTLPLDTAGLQSNCQGFFGIPRVTPLTVLCCRYHLPKMNACSWKRTVSKGK